MLIRPMPRIIINGDEIRSPLARFVLLVVGCVFAAIVLAAPQRGC